MGLRRQQVFSLWPKKTKNVLSQALTAANTMIQSILLKCYYCLGHVTCVYMIHDNDNSWSQAEVLFILLFYLCDIGSELATTEVVVVKES